jgi:hypothetical protein
MLNMSKNYMDKATVVTASGKVLKEGDGLHGVIIVDGQDHLKVMHVDEVSDKDIINFFIKLGGKAKMLEDNLTAKHEVLCLRPALSPS